MEENLGGNQLTQVHLEKWPLKLNVCVVYLTVSTSSDVFRGGGLCEAPPTFGRTAVIFVTILGLFLAPFRDKIAATSDQMRKCSKMRLRPGLRPGPHLGSLQRSPSAANLFTVDSRTVRRFVPAR